MTGKLTGEAAREIFMVESKEEAGDQALFTSTIVQQLTQDDEVKSKKDIKHE